MKYNSALLISLLCCTSFAALDYDSRMFSIKVEALGASPNIYWYYIHPFGRGVFDGSNPIPVVESQQVSRVIPYQNVYNKLQYNATGRVLFDFPISEHIDIGVYFGVETALKSGQSLVANNQAFGAESRPNCDANGIYLERDDKDYPTASSVIADQAHIVPGFHVLYDGFGVGIQYDMRKYETSKHMIPDVLDRNIDEDSILFGVRAQTDFHIGHFCFDVFGEGYSNLKERSSSEMGDYWLSVGRGMENTNITIPQYVPPTGTITSIVKISTGVSVRLFDY